MPKRRQETMASTPVSVVWGLLVGERSGTTRPLPGSSGMDVKRKSSSAGWSGIRRDRAGRNSRHFQTEYVSSILIARSGQKTQVRVLIPSLAFLLSDLACH